ncbi:MAG: pyruvate kinase, partial [Gammaproteobacteria bacterium]|nr:pyruvate kinase [Gammaproteobacteria bacterium]
MAIVTDIKLLKNRRTKIIATLGPASDSPEVIKQLIEAGANVFRLNMSHGEHASHENTYKLVRNIAEELGKPVAVLADLCGPKIRTGRFKNGQITLVNGTPVTVTTRDVLGEPGLIPSQYEALA